MRQILRARPIACFTSLAGLRHKAANFFGEVELRGAQPLVRGLLKIFLRNGNVFVCLVGVCSLVIW